MGRTKASTSLRAAIARLRGRLRPLLESDELSLEQLLGVLEDAVDLLGDRPGDARRLIDYVVAWRTAPEIPPPQESQGPLCDLLVDALTRAYQLGAIRVEGVEQVWSLLEYALLYAGCIGDPDWLPAAGSAASSAERRAACKAWVRKRARALLAPEREAGGRKRPGSPRRPNGSPSSAPAAGGPEAARERERIEEAAVELFLLHGFGAVSLKQIGDAVGVSEIAVARSYRTKQGLIHAILRHRIEPLLARLEPMAADILNLEGLLDVLGDAVDLLLDRPDDGLFLLYYTYAQDSEVTEPLEPHPEYELTELVGLTLDRAWERGVIHIMDPDELRPLLDLLLAVPALMTPPAFCGSPDGASPAEWRAACHTYIRDQVRQALAPEE